MTDNKKHIGAGVGVMISNHEGKVLLGQRHPDPKKASSALHGEGTWTLPGGKMEFGETFEQAAARETKEENGLDVFDLEVVSLVNDRVHDAQFITIGLATSNFKGEPKVLEPDKITKWDWFSLDQLPEPLFSASKNLIDNYIKGKIYIKDEEHHD